MSPFEYIFHGVELSVILGVGWRVLGAVNRLIFLMRDFPFHRHYGNRIFYPKGFDPPKLERMGD